MYLPWTFLLVWLADRMAKKWIQAAHLKKGAFTAYCGGKVTAACIARGKHSSNATTRKRAVLAETFRKMKRPHSGARGR